MKANNFKVLGALLLKCITVHRSFVLENSFFEGTNEHSYAHSPATTFADVQLTHLKQ